MSSLKPIAMPFGLLAAFHAHHHLIAQMIRREVIGRYRGSVFGLLWSFLNPLFMLAVYTFVFSFIFKRNWATGAEQEGTVAFAVILFAGLIIHALFAELVGRAPGLIVSNKNYVKKVVFPLGTLPIIALGAALFHALVSVLVLLIIQFVISGTLPLTSLWLPVVLVPFLPLLLGFGWILASLGVYIRDINQLTKPLITAMLFLSPVFFPLTALPVAMQPYLFLNPLTLIIEQTREVLIFGNMPDFIALGKYSIVAIIIAAVGFFWFQKTRKGFADVL